MFFFFCCQAGDEVCVTREVPRRVSAETERQTPRRVRLSASEKKKGEWTGSSREWTESSRAVLGKAGCAARVGQGGVAEQHVENKRLSAHSPKN